MLDLTVKETADVTRKEVSFFLFSLNDGSLTGSRRSSRR